MNGFQSEVFSSVKEKLDSLKTQNNKSETGIGDFILENLSTWILISLINIMGLVIVFTVLFSPHSKINAEESPKEEVLNHASHVKHDLYESPDLEYIKSELENNKEMLRIHADMINEWTHKTWVLGVVTSENFNLMKLQNANRNVPDPGYISINKDWKPHSAPKTLNLTEEQIEKFLK